MSLIENPSYLLFALINRGLLWQLVFYKFKSILTTDSRHKLAISSQLNSLYISSKII